MIVTCVHISVKPGKTDQFIEATRANHMESVKEPGNLRFDVLQQADNPLQFILYEVFESEAAVANHKTTAHYFRWREIAEDLMSEARKGVRYTVIEPNDPEKW
jgi:(4S)-4-hydroxy-5-phosphonooxypentane-2,3-dione isomerase